MTTLDLLICGAGGGLGAIATILASRKLRDLLTAGVEVGALRQEIKLVQLMLDDERRDAKARHAEAMGASAWVESLPPVRNDNLDRAERAAIADRNFS